MNPFLFASLAGDMRYDGSRLQRNNKFNTCNSSYSSYSVTHQSQRLDMSNTRDDLSVYQSAAYARVCDDIHLWLASTEN
jgi:hypothetical protein